MSPTSKKFDFIEAAASGYKAAWAGRHTLMALGWPVLIVKIICFMAVILLGLQDNYLRQGLIFLPGYCLEGWFIALALRYVLLGELWPDALSGDAARDQAWMQVRQIGLRSSMIVYVLIKLASAVVIAALFDANQMVEQAQQQGGILPVEAAGGSALIMSFGMIIAMLFGFWAFRYVWLYVPLALGYQMRGFLARIGGFLASFRLLGMWMISFTPIFIVMIVLFDGLNTVMPGASIEEGPLAYQLAFAVIQSGVDLLVTLMSTLACGFAVQQVMGTKVSGGDKA